MFLYTNPFPPSSPPISSLPVLSLSALLLYNLISLRCLSTLPFFHSHLITLVFCLYPFPLTSLLFPTPAAYVFILPFPSFPALPLPVLHPSFLSALPLYFHLNPYRSSFNSPISPPSYTIRLPFPPSKHPFFLSSLLVYLFLPPYLPFCFIVLSPKSLCPFPCFFFLLFVMQPFLLSLPLYFSVLLFTFSCLLFFPTHLFSFSFSFLSSYPLRSLSIPSLHFLVILIRLPHHLFFYLASHTPITSPLFLAPFLHLYFTPLCFLPHIFILFCLQPLMSFISTSLLPHS